MKTLRSGEGVLRKERGRLVKAIQAEDNNLIHISHSYKASVHTRDQSARAVEDIDAILSDYGVNNYEPIAPRVGGPAQIDLPQITDTTEEAFQILQAARKAEFTNRSAKK